MGAEEHRVARANQETNLAINFYAHYEANNLEERRTISQSVNATFIPIPQPAGRTVQQTDRR